MLTIRFLRRGKKNQPFFHVVVTDKRNAPRGGKFIERLGYFNPLTKEVSLKKERIEYWLKQGAKCSDTVHNLLIKKKVIKGKKIPVHKKSKKKKEKVESQEKRVEKPIEGAGEKPKEEESGEKPQEEKAVKEEESKQEEQKEEKEETKEIVEEKKDQEKAKENEKEKKEEPTEENKKSEQEKKEDNQEGQKENS